MPATIDDYKWINNNEKLPGLRDYFECLTAITGIVDKAIDLKKGHARKNIILEWEPSKIVATELIGWPYVAPDTTVLDLSPTELRERFLIVVEELERFDLERATLLTTQTSISDGVIWGFWRKGYGKGSGLDGTEEFDVQHQSTDSDDPVPRWGTRQGYGDEAPVVSFDLQSFDQTGVTYFVGAASFAEIDSVSRVPSFPSNVTDAEWGKRVLDPSDTDDQFQRPLNLLRMQDIQAFVRPLNNRILNSVIVYIPPESLPPVCNASARLEEVGESGRYNLKIDVSAFLQKHNDGVNRTWDQDTGLDLRPLMLIDGQHRTRGGAISPEGKDKRVPIVVLPPEMTLADVARIFTEINTGSEELAPLHQLHLRHRFCLASTQRKKDYRNWEDMEKDDSSRANCRANRMGYELAAKHACSAGPLLSRVRMMDVKQGGSNVATNAIVFSDYASSWFSPGFPFGREKVTLDDAFTVTNDYFTAWQMVVDRDQATGLDPWEDETNRWYPIVKKGTSGKPHSPYITMQIPFKAVLALFPLAYELAAKRNPGNPTGLDEFIEVLRPLHALDFSEIDLLKEKYGTDKHTANDLYNWFSWAIQDYDARGKIYPREEVWNPDDLRMELCKPGRGFFSPANEDLIQIHATMNAGIQWPETGDDISLWSPMLPNCSKQVEWQITVDDKDSPSKRSFCPMEGSNLDVRVTQEMAKAEKIRFTIFWRRSQQSGRLDPPGSGSLVLEKDESGSISFSGGSYSPPSQTPIVPDSEFDEKELADLNEGEYVLVTDFGEGPMMPPPPSNSIREPSTFSQAPVFYRKPWCQRCFFGEDHQETRNCFSYSGVHGGN